MLFNLYFNGIPFLLDKQDTDPIVLQNGCLLYADDLILTSYTATGLQNVHTLSILSWLEDGN